MELLILQGIWKDLYLKYWYLLNIQLLKPKLYSGNIANHPDAKYMSNAYLDAQIQKAKNTEEADRRAGIATQNNE